MHTHSNLLHIHKKVDEIETGLLRFQHNDNQVSLHVRVKSNGNSNSIDCFIADNTDIEKLVNGPVTLIQKSDKNYLYVSGKIERPAGKNNKLFPIRILRACWFVLKSKDSVSWLQEKYIFDISQNTELDLAS
ncbi:MAG: hypothetical protein ABI675_23200 [Chitinophagaceae bacterium]